MKTRIFNSTLYLFTAYYLVHFTYLGAKYLFLKLLGVQGLIIHFFYIKYLMPEDQWWTRTKVFLIFGGGLLFLLLLIIIIGVLFIKLSRRKYKLHTFYTWVLLVSGSFFIAEFFSAAFYGDVANLNIVMLWMYFQQGGGGMFFIAIILLLLIPVIGYLARNNFHRMANSTRYIKSKNSRLKFYFQTAIIPFLILCFILMLMTDIVYLYDFKYILSREIIRLTMLGSILIFGAYFSYNKNYISIKKSNNSHQLDFPVSMLLIITMMAIFLILLINHL